MPYTAAIKDRVGQVMPGAATPATGSSVVRDESFQWKSLPEGGLVTIDTPRSKAVLGTTKAGPHTLGQVVVTPGPNRQDWAAVTLTVVEGRDFQSPGKILVTATGLAENTGMKWKDDAHSSVGRNWGHRPALVEGIPATIQLPVAASRVRAWSLDEHGQRRAALTVRDAQGRAALEIGPAQATLWYEVEIRP